MGSLIGLLESLAPQAGQLYVQDRKNKYLVQQQQIQLETLSAQNVLASENNKFYIIVGGLALAGIFLIRGGKKGRK